MDRYRLIMLALMNDGMNHHKDAVINTISTMNLNELDEVEFDELWKNTNGHGGKDMDGFCSVCLEFLSKQEIIVKNHT